eukprot:3452986-Lingulodinium_polyedra.AAC.1
MYERTANSGGPTAGPCTRPGILRKPRTSRPAASRPSARGTWPCRAPRGHARGAPVERSSPASATAPCGLAPTCLQTAPCAPP